MPIRAKGPGLPKDNPALWFREDPYFLGVRWDSRSGGERLLTQGAEASGIGRGGGPLLVALSSAVAVAAVRGGTNETDLLYGTACADTIYALADGDALVGFWGNDRIYGGPGNDS